jgi:hypothetical protein
MDCVCASGRYEDATRAYRSGDGSEVVLPPARRRNLPAAAGVASSTPFGWGTGGLICPGGRVSCQELAAVVADLSTRRALLVGVRPSPAADRLWATAVHVERDDTGRLMEVFDALYRRSG